MMWFLTWLLAVELFALGALPMAVRLFRSLPDRGYLFAKPLGILVVGYICWLLGMFGMLRFQQTSIAIVLAVLGAACWIAWGREAISHLSSVRATIWVSEALFIAFFAVAAAIRAYNPQISGTEKPMDFAFLNALYRGDTLPPEDPWMSGVSISYYYFGYLLLAVVGKLSGVPATVGYNLSVALVFALLLAGTFSLAFNIISLLGPRWHLSRRLPAALLAPLLVGVMGNMEIGLEALAARGIGGPDFWQWAGVKNLQPVSQPTGWLIGGHWWWWRASRIIPTTKPDGINEFPYFSFLLGDLHPHFSALPWVLLAIALCLAAVTARMTSGERSRTDWLVIVGPALSLGFLFVGNSWDFPTYTALFWAASLAPLPLRQGRRGTLVVAELASSSALPTVEAQDEGGMARQSAISPALSQGGRGGTIVAEVKTLVAVSVCSLLLYSPFLLGFSSQTKGIGISADKTPLASMLIIFGPFMLILACVLAWWGRPGSARPPREKAAQLRWALWVLGVGLMMLSSLLGAVVLLLGLLALAGATVTKLLWGSEQADGHGARPFLALLAGGGLLLILVPEFLFLVDMFGTRMNTVFKFHYQAWLLLGLVASVGFIWLVAAARSIVGRLLMATPATLLVIVGLLYPLLATPAKAQDFNSQPTLDGAAFYQSIRPDDYASIMWLARAAVGRPVVLEASGPPYSEYARVSTFSGLPTVMGWAAHEAQWGRNGGDLQQRTQDIDAIYQSADKRDVPALLRKYRVEYVFVGSLEVEKYGGAVSDRFEGLLDTVNRQGRVVVYKVR